MLAMLAGAAIHTAILIDSVEQIGAKNQLVARELIQQSLERGGGEIIGTSEGMVRVRHEIDLFAGSDLTGLITGETVVGKELVVHAIHARSRRSERLLIQVSCAAIPESSAESELLVT